MKIGLQDLFPMISDAHVKLDQGFLRRVCCLAANSDKPASELRFAEQLGIKINERLKRGVAIAAWLNGSRTVPASKLPLLVRLSGITWSEFEKNILSIKSGQRGGEIHLKFPILIDSVLGLIVGHILGDGAIDACYNQVFFSNKNEELLNEFIEAMKSIFGVKPRIWQQNLPMYGNTSWDKRLNVVSEKEPGRCLGLFYPTICGRILNWIFDNFAIGHSKQITEPIKNSPISFKQGFLRALFDDEASCDAESYTLRMHQDDVAILENMRIMLAEFEIESNPVRSYLKHGKIRHYFNIPRKQNFRSFIKHIGFTSSQKQSRLFFLARPDQRCLVTPVLLQ